jgi:hypothetical protein
MARPMRVVNSTPSAEAIMHGKNAQYVVRFDGPVDHEQSSLEILRDGQVVERLHPLLRSAPEVLFASAPALEPGRYVLHWSVIPSGKNIDLHRHSRGSGNPGAPMAVPEARLDSRFRGNDEVESQRLRRLV